ncbi:hypothetical protein TVAG_126070 [Trichomonas vaginalis G3]|uniref:Uncharacterized protein n=1 Tax=Trichomonas vaginalis (strain ATCC PRA-98 / G3) TaxID=412133 RepID=A2ECZ5_TRIV3|nr:RNase H2-C domain-containing protein [Trichomonas vaginalis G3]EAY09446.1 hypothetical protein TVAG_126070 [Trichomonas vaginalis G3]KAI5500658.1 RNase H2-C domain-containing protein [Trichomonas vaginalis G3]|eukprot:XP_001321669.1 hypothetical protein [Trichomonas vaginalis G3]
MSVKVEWIPGRLPTDHEANVEAYFDSRVKKLDNGYLVGFFRGRELCGKPLELPEGYTQKIVKIEDGHIKDFKEVSKVTMWDLNKPQLDKAADFFDLVEISQALASD